MSRAPLPGLACLLAGTLVACARPAPPPAAAPAPSPPPQGARTLVVVRHAQSWKNVTPPPDLPPEQEGSLTPRGEEQARALGARLRGRGAFQVLSSPVERARHTADLIAAALSAEQGTALTVRDSPALAPLRAGVTPDGDPVSMDWREEQWGAGRDPRPEGGESLEDGARRALKLIAETPGDLVLVTHGDLAAALVGHAAGAPFPTRWEAHQQPTGSLTVLTIDAQGRWKIASRWSP